MTDRRHTPDRRCLPTRPHGSGRRESDPEPSHGTRARYQRGCTCTPCKAAEAAYRADLRRRHLKNLPILGQSVSSVEAWRQLRVLKTEYADEDGKGALAALSRRLGFRNGHLQIGRRFATLANVQKVERLYRQDILEFGPEVADVCL